MNILLGGRVERRYRRVRYKCVGRTQGGEGGPETQSRSLVAHSANRFSRTRLAVANRRPLGDKKKRHCRSPRSIEHQFVAFGSGQVCSCSLRPEKVRTEELLREAKRHVCRSLHLFCSRDPVQCPLPSCVIGDFVSRRTSRKTGADVGPWRPQQPVF